MPTPLIVWGVVGPSVAGAVAADDVLVPIGEDLAAEVERLGLDAIEGGLQSIEPVERLGQLVGQGKNLISRGFAGIGGSGLVRLARLEGPERPALDGLVGVLMTRVFEARPEVDALVAEGSGEVQRFELVFDLLFLVRRCNPIGQQRGEGLGAGVGEGEIDRVAEEVRLSGIVDARLVRCPGDREPRVAKDAAGQRPGTGTTARSNAYASSRMLTPFSQPSWVTRMKSR